MTTGKQSLEEFFNTRPSQPFIYKDVTKLTGAPDNKITAALSEMLKIGRVKLVGNLVDGCQQYIEVKAKPISNSHDRFTLYLDLHNVPLTVLCEELEKLAIEIRRRIS